MVEKKVRTKAVNRRSHPVSDWWTRPRVENGLRRFQRDFFPDSPEKLPVSINAYQKLVPAEEKARPARQRIYPPADAVLRHFENFRQAWWMIGFEEIAKHDPRREYELTEDAESSLRKIYSVPFGTKQRKSLGLPSLKIAAEQLQIPRHILIRFARELGLTRVKESPWSIAEIKILDEQGYKTNVSLVNIFRRAGFSRTEVAIGLMRQRRQSHKAAPFYSLTAIAQLFGVDSHKVADWANKGWLNAEDKEVGSASTGKGKTRVAGKESIYRFIVEHPGEFELKKVDQLWFLHLVTKGEIDFVRSERLSARSEAQLLEKPVENRKRAEKLKGNG